MGGGATAAFGSRVLRRGGILRSRDPQQDPGDGRGMPIRFRQGVRPGSIPADSDAEHELPMEYQIGAATFYSGPALAVSNYTADGVFHHSNNSKAKRNWED